MENYLATMETPAVVELQREKRSAGTYDTTSPGTDRLSADEVEHLQRARSLHLATVNERGWPYVQHRGGEPGFVKILGPTTIGWVERPGNRQYLGTGNITADGRVSLIVVDYARRTRLKLAGVAKYHPSVPDDLADRLNPDHHRDDGALVIDVVATAWNCPKHIPLLIDAHEAQATIAGLRSRIIELEARLGTTPTPPP